ncbi:hypothetical protein EV426DRAFT_606746 [Tirmania nivea]|nr:hypothetical protein EV426DRAFT_606746 [Tirmania nivea]
MKCDMDPDLQPQTNVWHDTDKPDYTDTLETTSLSDVNVLGRTKESLPHSPNPYLVDSGNSPPSHTRARSLSRDAPYSPRSPITPQAYPQQSKTPASAIRSTKRKSPIASSNDDGNLIRRIAVELSENPELLSAVPKPLYDLLITIQSFATPDPKRARLVFEIRKFRQPEEVSAAFGLSYSQYGAQFRFRLGSPLTPVPSELPNLVRSIEAYIQHFDRASESTCRSPIDFVLSECLTLLKGLCFDATSGQLQQGYSAATIKGGAYAKATVIHGEVSLQWTHPYTGVTYSGRVDYAIGVVNKGALVEVEQDGQKALRLPYQCYLLVVEAKRAMDVDGAVAQLFGYMAILHKLRRGSRSNLMAMEIYGIATDGLIYDFLVIDGEGIMKRGPRIDIGEGPEQIQRVVHAMLWILEKELHIMNQKVLQVTSRPGSRMVSAEVKVAMEAGLCQGEGLPMAPEIPIADLQPLVDTDIFVDPVVIDIGNTDYVSRGGISRR